MTQNLGLVERVLRFLIGIVLVGWAIAGGPWWAYLGLILLGTGAWGFCPIVWSIKSTRKF